MQNRRYENIFITKQDLSPTAVEDIVGKFKDIIGKQEGLVSKIEYCGLRPLSYPINKNRKGHYVLMNLEASHKCLKELERNMHLNEDVIRFININVEEFEAGPSHLLRQSRIYVDSSLRGSKAFSHQTKIMEELQNVDDVSEKKPSNHLAKEA